jgi:flavin prenyltransferase
VTTPLPLVLALTGASGAPYGVRLLEILARNRIPVWLITSGHGMRLLQEECAIGSLDALRQATGGDWSSVVSYPDGDRGALPASGSRRTAGMVICPCSMGTLAAVAAGTSRSLVERRKLVLVTREAPLSVVHLRNMLAVAEAGAVVLPASPGFYHRPAEVSQLVDFVVQRIIDQVGLDLDIAPRWGGTAR